MHEIQQWSDERLEAVHDYIQWLFPLPEPSPVNPLAPLITASTVEAFAAQPDLRQKLRVSLGRMLRFYGLQQDRNIVTPASNFAARADNWLWPGNHNHLRITRILKCCALLGLRDEARAFLNCLEGIYAEERRKDQPGITPTSLQYWRAALREA